MPQIVPPAPTFSDLDSPEFGQFFELVRKQCNTPVFYAQATDPGVTGVPSGTWSIWKNTTSGQVKVWANDNGTLKSVLLT